MYTFAIPFSKNLLKTSFIRVPKILEINYTMHKTCQESILSNLVFLRIPIFALKLSHFVKYSTYYKIVKANNKNQKNKCFTKKKRSRYTLLVK
jgi:hypothetical protein